MKTTFAIFFLLLLTALIPLAKPYPVFAQEGVWELDLANNFISSVETTPWGIMAGEFDTRSWLNPFNGVFVSKDLGASWQHSGLETRGVTGIKYSNNNLYASTYYWQNKLVGLFMSTDKGTTWNHVAGNFSALSVNADSQAVYLGGASHGLWISTDSGTTWTQKIGTGWFGPQTDTIECSEKITLAATAEGVYKSVNHGETWTLVQALSGLNIKYFAIHDNVILAGSTATAGGIYRSTDLGVTWAKQTNWGNYPTGDITYLSGRYFAGKVIGGTQVSVFNSTDLGVTWQDTGLNLNSSSYRVTGITSLFSEPSYLFASVTAKGVYKYPIPPKISESLPFLDVPWETHLEDEHVSKIYSFFDHSYPLLGYGYHTEPITENDTTENFLGEKEKQPLMYYSSHDGYDFSLKLGTDITAPAPGYATYYYCGACGNTIKIDHQNGYQTVYMHFQEQDLVATGTEKVWVEEGDVLGKVGMTGNTTGPHLHFAVIKDTDEDGSFSDETPVGKIDPFAWQSKDSSDPWPNYTWTDTLGTHTGLKSINLWKTSYTETVKYVSTSSEIAMANNKILEVTPESDEKGYTFFLQAFATPNLESIDSALKYIDNTSTLITAYDHFGNEIKNLSAYAALLIDLTDSDLSLVIAESLKLYYFDEEFQLWRALPTILDLPHNYLIGEMNHFSKFAVFGTKIDPTIPQTTISISGQKEGDWYVNHPTVTLTTVPSDASIFYVVGDTEDWNEYTQPIEITQEGLVIIKYRAMLANGNIEPVQDFLLKIDTQDVWKKRTLRIKDTGFEMHFNP